MYQEDFLGALGVTVEVIDQACGRCATYQTVSRNLILCSSMSSGRRSRTIERVLSLVDNP